MMLLAPSKTALWSIGQERAATAVTKRRAGRTLAGSSSGPPGVPSGPVPPPAHHDALLSEGAMSAWTMLPSSTGGQYNPARRHRRGWRMDVCLLLTCINLRGMLVLTTIASRGWGGERSACEKSPSRRIGTSGRGSRYRSVHLSNFRNEAISRHGY